MLCAPKLSLPWCRWECFQSKRRTHPIVHSCTPASPGGSPPLWSSHLHLNSETHFLYHITNFVGFLNYCFLISFGYKTCSPEGRYFFFKLVPLEVVFFNFLYPAGLFLNNIFFYISTSGGHFLWNFYTSVPLEALFLIFFMSVPLVATTDIIFLFASGFFFQPLYLQRVV